jgi:putative ATPase
MLATHQKPLAERMRPQTLAEYIGQEHLLGENGVLRKVLNGSQVPSIIFWGPPGVGKTTMARLIAQKASLPFFAVSAISSGIKEVRAVIEQAENEGKAILFIDEIHRFNKAQQDALLGAVEQGVITLIGATTENPSFEVIGALLSRCQVYVLQALSEEDLMRIIRNAIEQDEVLSKKDIHLEETEALFHYSGGDARKLLNALELVVTQSQDDKVVVNNHTVSNVLQRKASLYDKGGEQHYDIISAFIKSMRGSDPNAAVYWLARMLEGGEDPKFIARRMVILASEDIGNANPNALLLATSAFQAVTLVGMPEARIILSQAAVYLATSVKGNSSYMAINAAQELVHKTGDLPVPLHLRNAPTGLMKKMGYGKEYKYAHSYTNNFIEQEFLPEKLSGTKIFEPGQSAREEEMRRFLKNRWQDKYGY